ncbi:MAG: substrate-binding domain-containing protein [Chthoniobacterales bacterium]
MRKRPCVFFGLNTTTRYSRSVYKGACDYFIEKGLNFELGLPLSDELRRETARAVKGIIVIAASATVQNTLASYGVPVVNVSSKLLSPKLPSVFGDHEMAGLMAAKDLLNCRFHSFAYYGRTKSGSYAMLGRGFKKVIKEAGFSCAVRMEPVQAIEGLSYPLQKKLLEWISNLPKPVGIFCGNDCDAWEVCNACDLLDLKIGLDVGIVGYGNDELFCLTRHPQLSSVESRPDLIGYEAAALLHRLMRGARPPKTPILIPPAGVVQRASTDTFVSQDRHVTMAIEFIRQNIDQPLKVEQIFKHVPMSRRTLERHFHQSTGYTVQEAINQLKIERVKHLLITTSMKIDEIAHNTGFSSMAYMITSFRSNVGITPKQYRVRFQCSSSFSFTPTNALSLKR